MPLLVNDLHLWAWLLIKTCLNDSSVYFGLFAFVLSWELASALKEFKPKFDSAGVKLIAIGVGAPIKARILAGRVISLFSFVIFLFFLENYVLQESNIKMNQ